MNKARLSHRQAELLAIEVEGGRPITETDRMRLELHLEECEQCASRHQRVGALAEALRLEQATTKEPSDREAVARALMEAGTGRHRAVDPSNRSRAPYAMAAAAAVLLAVGVSWLWLAGDAPIASESQSGEEREQADEAPPPAEEEAPVELAAASEAAEATDELGAAPCRGVRTEWEEPAELEVRASDEEVCRLAISAGILRVHVDPEARMRVSIDTPTATVRVLGTVFRVSVGDSGTAVAVYRGEVEVETRAGNERVGPGGESRQHLGAGGSLEVEAAPLTALAGLAAFVGEEPPEVSPWRPPRARRGAPVDDLRRMLSAGRAAEARDEAEERGARPEYAGRRAELLTIIAESYVIEGQYERALDAYGQVWGGDRSSTAANALLAAADLHLERTGQPDEALLLYERYIRDYPRGPLREVAAVGRCRALGRGGRPGRAVSCAEAYLATHPDGRFRRQMEALTEE